MLAATYSMDSEADISDPVVPGEDPGDVRRGQPHEGDGQHQTEDQHPKVVPGDAGHGEDIVQRHGDIGNDDLDTMAERTDFFRCPGIVYGLSAGRCADLPEPPVPAAPRDRSSRHNSPTHPEEQKAAGQQEPDHLQQIDGQQGKNDPQRGGRGRCPGS